MAEESNTVTKEPNEEHNREVARLCFEFFKHFATITTAAALVEIGLYQQLGLAQRPVVIGIAALGLTMVLCIVGMILIPINAGKPEKFSRVTLFYQLLMLVTAGSFIVGVTIYALDAVGISEAMVRLVLPIILSVILIVIMVVSAREALYVMRLSRDQLRLARKFQRLADMVKREEHRRERK